MERKKITSLQNSIGERENNENDITKEFDNPENEYKNNKDKNAKISNMKKKYSMKMKSIENDIKKKFFEYELFGE